MSFAALVLTAGQSVAKLAAGRWLAYRAAKRDASTELVDLIKVSVTDLIRRRETERQFEKLAESVYKRLLPLVEQEFADLDDGTRESALREVIRTLERADLSDRAILDDNADPARLARRLREIFSAREAEFQLGQAGARLYELLLNECCDCLAHIIVHLPPFSGRAIAECLARLTSTVTAVDEILSRLPVRTLDAPEGTSLDEKFTREYLTHLGKHLDRLELFGVPFERLSRPRTTLSVAYISLNVTDEGQNGERNGREPFRLDEWRSEREESGAVRVERVLSESPRILIRGEAGSGKSTLLLWLAVTGARRTFTGELAPLNGCVPFLIKLRSHASQDRPLPKPEEFLDDVASNWSGLMPKGWAHRQLSSGRALLLVDGIDEISESWRLQARSWLAQLTRQFPGIRVIVTSRPAAAEANWLGDEGFGAAFLEQLGPADLRALIRQWHSAVHDYEGLPCAPGKLPFYETRLLTRMESAPHLRTLASTPLLAAMLCALNLDREADLPRNRMGLYSAVINMLIDTRDRKRDVPSSRVPALEAGDKIRLLQDLAWHLQASDLVETPRRTACQLMADRLSVMPRVRANADEVFEMLLERSGILREPEVGKIDFVHRTFQEYLAARRAAELGDMGLLIGKAHVHEWRETVVMASGHAIEPLREELIKGIAARARDEPEHATRLRQVIVACWETLPSITVGIAGVLEECLGHLIPPRDFDEARALAAGGETVLSRLPATLDGLADDQAVATAQTAWLVNGPEALDVLRRYAADERTSVELEISKAWDYFDSREYAKRVLAERPPGRGLYLLTDSPAHLAAIDEASPLAKLQAFLPAATDLTFLARHADSLRSLLIDFSGDGANLASLPKLPRLEELSIGAPGIADLSFLDSLPPLSRIWLTRCENVEDFSPLRRFTALRTLSLVGSVYLRDLGQLPPLGMVRSLALADARLEPGALSTLVRMAPNIEVLALKNCEWVNRLEPLGALRRLSAVELADCPAVDDLRPLAALPRLTYLRIQGIAPGTDLSPLAQNSRVHVSIARGQVVRGGETLGNRLRFAR